MTLTHSFKRNAMASAAALGLALAGVAATATPAMAQAQAADNALVLSIGGSKVINLPSKMSDVILANPEVADVNVRSETQLVVIAKAPGVSGLTVTSANGKVLYSTTVRVGNNLTSIDQMLKMAMPDAAIQVTTLNGMVLLTGTIKAPEDAAEAERLTAAFVGKDTTVVSRLRTATPLQVMLQVKIAEVNRNLIHKIGMNWKTFDPGGNNSIAGGIGRGRDFGTFDMDPNSDTYRSFTFNYPTDGSTSIGFLSRMFGMDVAGALDLAETSGLATLLAQPNLTALSGETASFLAGGEYPYQVSNGLQGNSIEFKQYGVQLAFTPTVLADGRISLRVRPTVSSLDFSINSNVPALKNRTAETSVELGSGQAFMIAGLLSADTGNNIDKVPGIGNIPILGSLFKSRQFLRNETELVIVVTPYLVKPVNAADIHLPTDGFRSATEGQGLILQQGSDGVSGAKRPEPKLDTAAPASPQASATPKGKGVRSAKAGDAGPGFSF